MSRIRELSETVRAGRELSPLEQEIAGEMASTLGRAGERVEAALARVTQLGAEADALEERVRAGRAERSELRAKLAEFNAAIEHAEVRTWELVVQREALGFRRHEAIPRVYPLPRRRRVID